jgi:hypothetical protein
VLECRSKWLAFGLFPVLCLELDVFGFSSIVRKVVHLVGGDGNIPSWVGFSCYLRFNSARMRVGGW